MMKSTKRGQNGAHGKWLKRLLAVAMGCGLGCALSEIGLRTAEIGYPHFYAPDEYCGKRLRAGTSGVWIHEGHGHVSINSRGFRGSELSLDKPPAIRRVAVLGDSFVEGFSVDDDQTLCALLEKRLNDAPTLVRRKHELINCGVSGYGTAQQLEMLRHHVLPFKPDMVLLAVYPENDIADNHRGLRDDVVRPYFTIGGDGELRLDNSFQTSVPYMYAHTRYKRCQVWLINRLYVLQAMRLLKASWTDQREAPSALSDNIEDELAAAVESARFAYAAPTRNEPREAWAVTERLIQEMAVTCRSQNIVFVVFTVSSSVQVYPDAEIRRRVLARVRLDDFFWAERRLQALCGALSIHFIPLATRLREVVDESGEYLHGFSNVRLGLGHWSQAGHAAAARILADALPDLFSTR